MKPQEARETLSQRNRTNQRNFRARRQQYLNELEQKVKAYKDTEVKASQHVQAAARIIVDENRILRNLLQEKLGISDGDITHYVAQVRQSSSSSPSPSSTSKSISLPRNEISRSAIAVKSFCSDQYLSISDQGSPSSIVRRGSQSPADHHDIQSTADSIVDKSSGVSDSNQRCYTSLAHPSRDKSVLGEVINTTGQPLMDTACAQCGKCSLEQGPDRMSCEEAAAIITSMNTTSSVSDVFQELGCSPAMPCKIRTAEVFELISTRM